MMTYDKPKGKQMCQMCRRRVKLRIRENCCGETYYTMPPHKPKNWYKDNKRVKDVVKNRNNK